MREPYIELGIGIIGQAIRDWRLESKAHNYKMKTANMRKIESFMASDFAHLLCNQIDIDPKILMENLKKENRKKWLEYERAEAERIKEDGQGQHINGCEDNEQITAVCEDSTTEGAGPIRFCD